MLIKALLALTIALAAVLPARAQSSLGMWPEPADELVRQAIDSPSQDVAVSVRKNGDPFCLKAKALDDAASVARGRALFPRYASR